MSSSSPKKRQVTSVTRLNPISEVHQPNSPCINPKRNLLTMQNGGKRKMKTEPFHIDGVLEEQIYAEESDTDKLSSKSQSEIIHDQLDDIETIKSPKSEKAQCYKNPFQRRYPAFFNQQKKSYVSASCQPKPVQQTSKMMKDANNIIEDDFSSNSQHPSFSPKSPINTDLINYIDKVIKGQQSKMIKSKSSSTPNPDKSSILQNEVEKSFYKVLFKQLGDFLNKLSESMVQILSKGKITFQELKTEYCWNTLSFMLDVCRAHDMSNTHGSVRERSRMMNAFNQQIRKVFEFLQAKFSPLKSMGSDDDCNVLSRIADVNKIYDVNNDILLNCGMKSDRWIGKDDYCEQIKTLINKLIRQTRKQHPIFLQTMQQLMQEDFDDQYEQSTCKMELTAALMDSTDLYTHDEIKTPGLKLKSGEILGIMIAWTNQLFSNFGNSEEVIVNRIGGFKSQNSQGFTLTKRRRVTLAENLKEIYQKRIKIKAKQREEVLNSLLVDLLSGILKGYRGHQGLNTKQVMIAKLSQYLYECLQADLSLALNQKINMLNSVREKYEADTFQSTIDLVSFGIYDLLKCKITGSKVEIVRSYKRIIANKGYYEIIQLKNRIGTVYNDLIIHLKLAGSFIICQVQLLVADTTIKIANNYLSRMLNELRTSRFPVAYECASCLIQLDPSISYFDAKHPVEFRGYVLDYALLDFRDDTLYCRNKHNEVKMHYMPSYLPFWCKACKVFYVAYSFGPQFLRCNQCLLTICPKCLVDRWSQFQNVFMTKYMNKAFIEEFLNSNPVFYGFYNNKELEAQILKVIQPKGYFVTLQYDCQRVKVRVVKKFGGKLVDGFITLRDITKNKVTDSKYNWCTVMKLKNLTKVKLQSILFFQKVQIGKPWHEIEDIFEEGDVKQVMICQSNRKIAMLVDLPQNQAAINKTLADVDLEEMLNKQNEKEEIFLELSSRNIANMITINQKITNKENVRLINLWENKISNVESLVQYPKLNELYLRENFVTDITPLLKLTTLLHLNLQRNELAGKFPVISFPLLKSLDISCNKLTDVSQLGRSNLQSLTTLLIGVNRIEELPILKCPKLDTFYFQLNGVTNLNNLKKSQLPMIQKIHGCKNRLRGKLPALPFPMLSVLWLHDNFVQDLSEFAAQTLQSFQWLRITNNSVRGDLPVFKMPSLLNFELQNNELTNISSLTTWKTPNLQTLVLSSNRIQGDLPLMNFKELKQLNLSRNTIGSIDNIVRCGINKIEQLDISHNQIYGPLPILKFPKLNRLNLQMNRFDDALPLQQCILPALQFLDISQNHIRTSIPILQFENLNEIRITENSIRSLYFLRESQLVPKLRAIIVHPSELVLLPDEEAKLRTYTLKDAFLEKRKSLERKRLQIQRV